MPVGRGYQEVRPTLFVCDDGTRRGFTEKRVVGLGRQWLVWSEDLGRSNRRCKPHFGSKSKRLLFELAEGRRPI
jgi:hypothetical protein